MLYTNFVTLHINRRAFLMEYISRTDDELEIFRAIILYGQNTASYKFAFGQALLELAQNGKTFVSLDELAKPFSKHIVDHLKSGKRQTVTSSSKFLYGCQLYIDGKIDEDELIGVTKKFGFKYVIDAFPRLKINYEDQPVFYEKAVVGQKGIQLTDNLHKLTESNQVENLAHEIEGRWNLVETSWTEQNPNFLIEYDDVEKLFVGWSGTSDRGYLDSHLRTPVTKARKPLSGYQKGKCFFCYDDISIESNQINTAQVDHFFPISLQSRLATNVHLNLNDIWNLVLSCKSCNLSKSNRTPALKYLYNLERRNNYYIHSKHPLGHTIMTLTGQTISARRSYLNSIHAIAKEASSVEWKPKQINGFPF